MRTAQLDQIVRQRDPELLKVVEHLSRAEVAPGLALLQSQGRITEIPERTERIQAIARDYAASPERTLIVSPDNASRRDINEAVHLELQQRGRILREDHPSRVLIQRSEMTGADRAWASRYQVGDVLRYQRGSAEIGLQAGSYASIIATEPKGNTVTVRKQNGEEATYNPARLRGIDAYAEVERNFSVGDRIQFTAPNQELHVANRALGTVEQIEAGMMAVKMDTGKTLTFDPQTVRHFDHGYAVTSHSSQGLTADRVLVNVDHAAHPDLINSRFAYVSLSRASLDARIFTDDVSAIASRLSHEVGKTSAIDFSQTVGKMGSEQNVQSGIHLGM
jgi:hypothetical protein